MNINNYKVGVLIALFATLFSCKKADYIIGGSTTDVNQYSNMTNMEYIQSNDLFDTVAQVIAAANFQETINQSGTTLFLPTDGAVYNYLNSRTLFLQGTVNQYAKFTLDSLKYYLSNNINKTRDSLKLYLLNTSLKYADMTTNGILYPTMLANDTIAVSYETTRDANNGYNGSLSSLPKMVYFTQLWSHYTINDANPISKVNSKVGTRVLVQTSGIYTKSGSINVLGSGHTLFFYGLKQ